MQRDAELDNSKRIWFVKKDDILDIGLTQSFIQEIRDECWHIIPNYGQKQIKKGAPLFSLETNDQLVSVISPFSGWIMGISDRATNDPHLLEESDVIMQLSLKEKKKDESLEVIIDDLEQDDEPQPSQRGPLMRNTFVVSPISLGEQNQQWQALLHTYANRPQRAWAPLRFTLRQARNAFSNGGTVDLISRQIINLDG